MSNDLAKQPEADLAKLFQEFISDEVAGGMAAADTAKTYQRETARYWEWCREAGIDPLQATRDNVVTYRRRLGEKYAPASVSLKLSAVRRFYAGAVARGIIDRNPAVDVRGPKQRRNGVEYFSEAELDRVFRAIPRDTLAGRRDAAILGLMGLQGLRVVEITRLDVGDLRNIDGAPHLRVTGKGGHEDLLPILPGLADRIREYLEARGDVNPDDPMFASTRNTRASRIGDRVARRTVQQICAKYYGKAEVTGRAHTLRHTAATLALKNGADLLQVQAMLRHTDSKTTARYAHALNRVEENPALRIPVECG